MDWHLIAGVSAGITGITGLIGFVIFAVLKLSSRARLDLPTETINSLKEHGIKSEDLKGLSPAKLRVFLGQHQHISKDLISKVLAPQVTTRGRNVLIISICLILLAALLGVVHLTRSEGPKNSATVTNSDHNQIAQGGSQIINTFPRPTKITPFFIEKTGTLDLNRTDGALVTNPKLKVYRYLIFQLRPGCSCLGNSNDIPLRLATMISSYEVESETTVVTASLVKYIEDSMKIAEKWSSFLSKYASCGSMEIEIPFSFSYDDQFSVGRNLYYVLYKNVTPNGMWGTWNIDTLNDESFKGHIAMYNLSHEHQISSQDDGRNIFSQFFKTVKSIIPADIMRKVDKKEKIDDLDMSEQMSAVFYSVSSTIHSWTLNPKAIPKDLKACVFNPNEKKGYVPFPGFKPIELIGPSTEPKGAVRK